MAKKMTPAQWRQYAAQWKRAGPELDRIRDEELRRWKYDWKIVDALLDIGAMAPRKEEEPNGLVEMQKWFMKLARKQGLLPTKVREAPGPYGAPELYVRGDPAIFDRPMIALFCSVKCPGKLILDTYDFAKRLRDEGVTVISGFHSPMEQECLRILLRSPHKVVWCLARGLWRRVPSAPVDCRKAVAEGRLVIASAYPEKVRRATRETALARNGLVAELASVVVVAHAAPGSSMERFSRELLAAGKALYTFDHPANAALLAAGAKILDPASPPFTGKSLADAGA